ncbi:MAG: adenylate/guanylate cyclase domain-containing protein [Desulfobacterales bacterium]|nr:adenylate/guanylate cyclase domain-containing protein [Desulfobacterales bacterium]
MESKRVKRKLAAIVSVDVKGYSRLMTQNDARTVRSLKACRQLMTQEILEYNGRVVDSPGDNLLAEFPSVTEAVECAVLMQKALLDRNKNLPDNQNMEFRMGINLGDIIEDGDQIFGDGINLAARLESLAEAGGICISANAYDQVKNKLALGYKFMGNKKIKNISDTVPVYMILTDPKFEGKLLYNCNHDNPKLRRIKKSFFVILLLLLLVSGFVWKTKYSTNPRHPGKIIKAHIMQLHLPDKPSIAVLPFMNLSGDLDQEYFSDGLAEDLITDLSKISGLFVISRNSAFSYKGKNVKVDKISKELGVRFILEGSVRKIENRVRITAQLIDATTGGHIWAERYDRDLKDIFSLQDEVRKKIVTALAVQLTPDDQKRLKNDTGVDFNAYDYYLRGKKLLSNKFDDHAFKNARILFQKAIDIDPDYVDAHYALGHALVIEWVFDSRQDSGHLIKAREIGEKILSINQAEGSGHALLANVYLWTKQNDKAVLESRIAISLDPNNVEWIAALGEQLIWAGQPKEGTAYMNKAIRMDPNYPSWYLWNLGHAYFLTKEFEKAIDSFERSLLSDSSFWPSYVYLSICYDNLGLKNKAAESIQKVKKLNNNLSSEVWEKRLPYKDPYQAAYVVNKLKELGIYQ